MFLCNLKKQKTQLADKRELGGSRFSCICEAPAIRVQIGAADVFQPVATIPRGGINVNESSLWRGSAALFLLNFASFIVSSKVQHIMQERRRHQRVRFSVPPDILIGCNGVAERGVIENLSLSGLMLRGNLPLVVGRVAGCEFSLCGSPLVDVPLTVVSHVGDIYGVRFQPGLISQVTIDDAVVATLAHGSASVLGVHEVQGRKILRIMGGLNGGLHNDFVHAVTRVGVDEIDVSAVTAVDQAGLQLCLEATGRFQVDIGAQSACFSVAWKKMLHAGQSGAREDFL